MKNFYRDIALPRNVAEILHKEYGFTKEAAEKQVQKHKKYIKLAWNAYPVQGPGSDSVIADVVARLRKPR